MDKFETILKEALAYRQVLDSPDIPLSAQEKAGILAALSATRPRTTVSESVLQIVMLKELSTATMSGSEMIERLSELKIGIETEGDGAILGILHQIEQRGLAEVKFDEGKATRIYQISQSGSGLLQKAQGVLNDSGLSALWST